MMRTSARASVLIALLAACHARPRSTVEPATPAVRGACSETSGRREQDDCLLSHRFGSDERALGLARALTREGVPFIGVDTMGVIEGYRGERVELIPALPIGDHAHHLDWIRASLQQYDAFIRAISQHAKHPVAFGTRPDGIVFFRTAGGTYPSAYCAGGLIGYNIEGPLNASRRVMHETLFHELFHINDERLGFWSDDELSEVFDGIVERCDDDHVCYSKYAPHDSMVEDGTYYAFDPRTRHVREYAAEIALAYFVEHETILRGARPRGEPFKCRARENAVAWGLVVEEFFGGVDLTRRCKPVAGHDSRSRL